MKVADFPPGTLTSIREWQTLTHTELAVICEAFYGLLNDNSQPETIRKQVQQVRRDFLKGGKHANV